MKKLPLTLLLLIAIVQVYAQNVTVSGIIQSASDQATLPGANVVLIRSTDQVKAGTATDMEGKFRIENVRPGQYTLEVNYLGYEKLTREIRVENSPINLGILRLADASTTIGEIQIIGRAPLGEQKGDTSQFNAKAFKTAPDASAEDLVSKMPGVVIQNGTIQAQGEDVRQIMIDGKRIVGEDVNSAVRNLPADMIESVQVFDAQSDQAAFSGFEDGNRQKTLNFITKKDRRQGYTGKVSAGYGTDDRYMIGASVNFFKDSRRITVTGLTNNINMFDFSVGETPGGGMRGRRGGWGGGSPNGIINTNTFGLNYNDMWGKRIEVSSNYNLNNRDIENNQFRFRDYLNDTTYTENSFNNNKEDNHRFNFRFQYNINENNRLLVTPSLSLQQNKTFRETNAFFAGDQERYRESFIRNNDDITRLNFNNNILFSHRFGDSGRILTTNLNTRYSNRFGDQLLFEERKGLLNPNEDPSRNQLVELQNANFFWSGNLNYSQRLGKKSRLQLEYTVGNQVEGSDRIAYNRASEAGGRIDSLSNSFNSGYLSQSFGPSYQYRTEKTRFQANLRYQYATLNIENQYPEIFEQKRTFNNILPSAEFEYKISETRNLNINLRTNTNVPSADQLQDVLDVSNPLQLRVGNPELDQDNQTRLFLRYRNFNRETNRVFFIGVFGTMTENYIANSVYTNGAPAELADRYDIPRGTRLSRPVNLDGFRNVRTFFNFGQPVNLISSNVNFNGSIGYTRTPGMINDEINFANTTNFGAGINLSSNISEKVDFTISTHSNYNIVENTLSSRAMQNNNYFTQNTNLRYSWILWQGLVYRTELQHQYNSGLSAGVDNNFLLWNMSLGKKLFKNQQGEISFSVNDLLKQNVSIQRNIQTDYIEDVQSTVLQRFFMVTFSYNIRKFSGGEAPEMNQDRRRDWGGGRSRH